jgi:phosphoribosylglycinamide formyltransferase-1
VTLQRVVVLASGSGTLLQALLDADDLGAAIVAVGSDRSDVAALQRAAHLPTFTVALRDHPDRAAWDAALTAAVAQHEPDWVVTAGFMRLLGPAFLARFGGRVVNSHPALLPAFPGSHGVRDALAYGVKVTGCTVHLVDAGVDSGPIIAQEAVPVVPGDDEEQLHERIKVIERRLLVRVVRSLAQHGYTLTDRLVSIP